MRKTLRGLLIGLCILCGILLISNLDKAVQRYEPDQLLVKVGYGETLAAAVAKVPETRVLDASKGLVAVPYGYTDETMYAFLKNQSVMRATKIQIEPTFSLNQYAFAIQKQLGKMAQGNFGATIYDSRNYITQQSFRVPQKEYPIVPQLPAMIGRSFATLIPALLMGIVCGYLLAIWAVWRPKVGRVIDALHALLLSLPDFFIVALLQMGAILLTKAVGHNIVPVMQFGNTVPFLIPFLAISILPGALVYGTQRLALQREWQEGYIKTAYSKGLGRTKVLLVHILRNTAEDLFSILPRAVSVAITSLVVAEVMTHVFGLGGYVVNESIVAVTSLPTTCAILAVIALAAHVLTLLLRKKFVVNTKEGGA